MSEPTNQQIVEKMVEAIQNKKGKQIAIVDMTKLGDTPCQYFVIAEGTSNTQVNAIADEIDDLLRSELKIKPFATDGQDNAIWVCMDYGQIIVHIFQREAREFYDIEHLWADANIRQIADEN